MILNTQLKALGKPEKKNIGLVLNGYSWAQLKTPLNTFKISEICSVKTTS